MARRSLLVDFITVYGLGGKAIVFTETKREADEVAAALANTHPCEVRCSLLVFRLQGSPACRREVRRPCRWSRLPPALVWWKASCLGCALQHACGREVCEIEFLFALRGVVCSRSFIFRSTSEGYAAWQALHGNIARSMNYKHI